jgi:acyl-coenzyme A synthetase/AMP-(fatty) acid ligase
LAGYWNDPETTAATMVDGWVATGDVYRRDADGAYWHDGRADDLFKVKGLWVSPSDVEDALMECPEILEAAVVAGKDGHGMGIAVAYVVVAPEAPHEGLLDAVRPRLASLLPTFKCPSELRVVDSLPRTATGKIQRFKLREGWPPTG